MNNRRIFVDMDGVLADFERHHVRIFGYACNWTGPDVWKSVPGFFSGIPPMPDMVQLWTYVEPYSPIVLTGLPSTDAHMAWGEKRAWLNKHIGTDVPMIGCRSKDKCLYGRPGDILIDDREEFSKFWRGMGGVWITHTSAQNSIKQLQEMGI